VNDKDYRDLAAMTIAGLVSAGRPPDAAARRAFDLADALVEERRKRGGKEGEMPKLAEVQARLLGEALAEHSNAHVLDRGECEGRVEWACEGLRKDISGVKTAAECSEEKRLYKHLVAAALRGAELWEAEERRLREKEEGT